MGRAIGRIERPGEREFYLRRHLMGLYAVANTDFMASLSAILERYRGALTQLAVARFPGEVMTYYFHPRHDLGWQKACTVANGWLDLRGYPDELQALVERWGLRCDWAAPWLHACLTQYLYPPLSSLGLGLIPLSFTSDLESLFEHVRGEDIIRIEVRYQPWPPMVQRDPSQPLENADLKRGFISARQKAIDEAMDQLKQQMGEIDRKHLSRGYVRRDTAPELWKHMHWLYLRICPQEDIGRPWGYQKIAGVFRVSKTTVRDAVLALAHEMGITLPKLPPGRVPEYA